MSSKNLLLITGTICRQCPNKLGRAFLWEQGATTDVQVRAYKQSKLYALCDKCIKYTIRNMRRKMQRRDLREKKQWLRQQYMKSYIKRKQEQQDKQNRQV